MGTIRKRAACSLLWNGTVLSGSRKAHTKSTYLFWIIKKQERAAEIQRLESKIEKKQTEFDVLSKRIKNFDKGAASLSQMQEALDNAPEYQLPEPQGFMTAKNYKSKIVEPLFKKLKSLVKTLMVRCFQAVDDYQRLNQANASLYRSNERLKETK